MLTEKFRPVKKVIVATVSVVAATYAYFLLFAQFGFLKALQEGVGGAPGVIKPVMAIMGLAGIAGSVLAARIFTEERSRRILAAGFGLSAAAAGLSLVGGPRIFYSLVALLVGLGVGLTTVTLAGMLRRVVGGARLGMIIGLGTGLAYGFCNLPVVFNATAGTQALVAMLICGAGGLAAMGLTVGTLEEGGANSRASTHDEGRARPISPLAVKAGQPEDFDYSKLGIALWVLLFFTLVGLDSAGFYIIQHTPQLAEEMWRGEWQWVGNAGMHLGAAVLAGYALDRRWAGRTLLVAAGLLVGAGGLIDGVRRLFELGALLYTAGVSVYSVALVFYPARSLRPGLAALVYAVAGWGGSALGIGFAENLHAVPRWFIAAAGVLIVASLAVRHGLRKDAIGRGAG